MNHYKNHPFTGGDDICAIVEKRDVPAIEIEFLKNYTIKGSDAPGRSGLIIDGFKHSNQRFDFLSYDCVITSTGLEVVKQVQRAVRYGTSTIFQGKLDHYVDEVLLTTSS